jgi:hypothetical protein
MHGIVALDLSESLVAVHSSHGPFRRFETNGASVQFLPAVQPRLMSGADQIGRTDLACQEHEDGACE